MLKKNDLILFLQLEWFLTINNGDQIPPTCVFMIHQFYFRFTCLNFGTEHCIHPQIRLTEPIVWSRNPLTEPILVFFWPHWRGLHRYSWSILKSWKKLHDINSLLISLNKLIIKIPTKYIVLNVNFSNICSKYYLKCPKELKIKYLSHGW